MDANTITIAGTSVRIEANNGEGSHIETLVYRDTFFDRDIGFRIWVNDRKNGDKYRYEDASHSCYSHPTLEGARRMIINSLVTAGLIQVPRENTHLDDRNLARLKIISDARTNSYEGKPRIGDVVYIDNVAHRISATHTFGTQTSKGGSFHIGTSGFSSFSGSLDATRLYECFEPAIKLVSARFWMWDSKKGAGAGNGVDIYVNTQAWTIIDHNYTKDEILNHPSILHYRKLYGDYSFCETDIAHKIKRIQKGLV